MKRKWKYLFTMYGSTVGINLLLFMVIFPLLANVSVASPTGDVVADIDPDLLSSIKLKVNIPCPGHAPLISNELKTIDGVAGIKFSFPNNFNIFYDSTKTSKQEMLLLDVFKSYPATVLEESATASPSEVEQVNSQPSATGGCGCGGSTCGAAGGSCCGA